MGGRSGDRNPVTPEAGVLVDWAFGGDGVKPRNVRWSVTPGPGVGYRAMGGPVVSGGLVWVGTVDTDFGGADRPTLACFRESDGKLVYEYKSDRLPDRLADWPNHSLTGSPLAEGDRLWFCTNRREVVCLDTGPLRRGTGGPRVVWALDLMARLGVSPSWVHTSWPDEHGSPAGYGEFLYVPTGNAQVNEGGVRLVRAPGAPSLVCLRKSTGDVVWSDNSPGRAMLTAHRASPLVAEVNGRAQVIHPQADGWVRSFDALTGKLIWKFDVNPKSATGDAVFSGWRVCNGERGRVAVFGAPVFAGGRVYFATGMNPEGCYGPGRLACVDPTKTGDVSPELGPTPSEGRPNPNSALVWEFARFGPGERDRMGLSLGSVAVHAGLVFAADTSGFVHCLDAATGKRHWSHDCDGPVTGHPLVAGGKLVVANGDVWVLDAAAAKRVHGKRENPNDWFSAGPVYANGALYVLGNRRLVAIGVK